MRLLFSGLLIAALVASTRPATAGVSVDVYGHWTREDYVMLQRVSTSLENRSYVLLQKFAQATEYRLPVVDEQHTSEGIELLAKAGNRSARLQISGSSVRVSIDNSGFRPLVNDPRPSIRRLYYGYYTRENYVLAEAWMTGDGQTRYYLVQQDFPRFDQVRSYVRNHFYSNTEPSIEFFQCGSHNQGLTLEVTHSTPRTATFAIGDSQPKPLRLLE
jgi:hypothetical protein